MKNHAIFILLFSMQVIAQDKQVITGSMDYYYGESVAEQEQEARDNALKQLIEQIAVKVSSFNDRELVENNGDLKDIYRSILKTYSNATLKNVQSIKRQTDKGIEVFCYISKDEVVKIFEERKALVRQIYEKGKECESDGDISDALKYYYFSIILMNSIPEKDIEEQSKNLIVEIPARINTIISYTKFSLNTDNKISEKEREIQFRINSFGKPVQQLDFSFWDGASQVSVKAVDGVGAFRLYSGSASFDKLNIEIKYNYYESRDEISEVADLWGLVVKPSFKNSQMVSLIKGSVVQESSLPDSSESKEKDKQITAAEEKANSAVKIESAGNGHTFQKYSLEIINNNNCPVAEQITEGTEKLLEVLDSKNAGMIQTAFKSDKFIASKIAGLVRFNAPQVIQEHIKADINKTMTGWELRRIRVLTYYPTLNRQAGEYLILDFDTTGKLNDVNFGLYDQLYTQFVKQGEYGNDWGNRQVIVKFVERYRTAYLTRNMAMLDSLFADEAVIIIGRELRKGRKRDDFQYAKLNDAQPDYSYTQYTKKEYLKNQKKAFENQKDLFLGFSSFKISRKNDSDGTYGLSMKQNYTSSGYADEGHLFLLVDFQQTQPQIYVRSWQPHEWNEDAIIKLANFKLNK